MKFKWKWSYLLGIVGVVMSVSDLAKDILDDANADKKAAEQQARDNTIYNNGHNRGYEHGVQDFADYLEADIDAGTIPKEYRGRVNNLRNHLTNPKDAET